MRNGDGSVTTWSEDDGVPFAQGAARVTSTLQEANPFCYAHTPTVTIAAYTPPPPPVNTEKLFGAQIGREPVDVKALQTELERTNEIETTILFTIQSLCSSNDPSDFKKQRDLVDVLRSCRGRVLERTYPTDVRGSDPCSDKNPPTNALTVNVYAALLEAIGKKARVTLGDPTTTSSPGSDVPTKDSADTAWTTLVATQKIADAFIALLPVAQQAAAGGIVISSQIVDPNQTVSISVSKSMILDAVSPAPATSAKSAGAALPAKAAGSGGTTDPSSTGMPIGSVTLHTQSPVYFSVGIGPAFISENTRAWSVVTAPGAPAGAPGAITRTTDSLNFDAMVAVSPYWSARYLRACLPA